MAKNISTLAFLIILFTFSTTPIITLSESNRNSSYLLQEGHYFEYVFLRSYNFINPFWSGQIRVSGSDKYLVKTVSDKAMSLEEYVEGNVSWPEGTEIGKIFYLYMNNSIGTVEMGKTFSFRSKLTFVNGVLKNVEQLGGIALPGYIDVIFCFEEYTKTEPLSGNLSLGTPIVPLFLTQKPLLGGNLVVEGVTFKISSSLQNISVGLYKRRSILGNATLRSGVWTRSIYGYWDEETGILLRLAISTFSENGSVTDFLLWELSRTNAFATMQSYKRSMTLNITYDIDSDLHVSSVWDITICDIFPRESMGLLINKAYDPHNFTAYDKNTGAVLVITQGSLGSFYLISIKFPREVQAGESYSFTLRMDYGNIIREIGNIYEIKVQYSAMEFPVNYSLLLSLPSTYKTRLEESLISLANGTYLLIKPVKFQFGNKTGFKYENIYLMEKHEVWITLDFWLPVHKAKVLQPIIARPAVLGENNNITVIVENEGDDSNFTVTLIGSEGLQISGNQTIFIESRKRASLTFNFTPHSLGQMYVVATVYWNKERLDTSLPLIFEVVEDFLIVLFRTLLVGLFSLLCGLLTVIIVRKKFKRSKNLAFMIGWGTISVTIFLTYILFIPTLKETVAQVVTIISTIVGIYTLILAITQKRS